MASQHISRLDAEVLLAHVLTVQRAFLFAFPEKTLTHLQCEQFHKTVRAVKQGMPVAYLTGIREFWSLSLKVTPDTLIPRPETECLVEQVLAHIQINDAVIADCGTGSGAIALALATERPHWKMYATDQSAAALQVARENAKNLKINNVSFFQGNWCDALPNIIFDAIVSNPPYLAETDPHLPALSNEPRSALVSGGDGLQAIREIVKGAAPSLKNEGYLFVEHGCDQASAVQQIFFEFEFKSLVTVKDIAGLDRVTLGRIVKTQLA